MPGKKQLRKFSDDVLKIGDEVKIRASRGEKPAVFPVPDDIPDVDDSQDFVLGMPDPEDESHAVPNSSDGDDIPVAEAAGDDEPDGSIPLPGDEDLAVESDIPDLSDILNSIGGGDLGGDSEAPDAGIIGDLSGDISGDLGTDSDIETLGDDSEVLDSGTLSTDSDDFDLGGLDDIGAEPVDDKSKVGDAEAVDAEPASDFASEPESNSIEDIEGVDDLGNNDSADLSDDSFELPDVSSTSSDSSTGSDDFDLGDLNFDDLGTDGAGSEESAIPDEIADNVPGEPASTESLSEDIPATEDVFGGDFGLSDIPAEPSSEDAVLDDTFATDTVPNDALSNDGASSDNVSTASMPGGENTVNDTDDFGIDDLDFGDFNTEPATGTEDTFGMESPVPTDNAGEDNSPAAESFDLPDDGDAFAGSSDVPDMSADDMAGDSGTASDISSDFADMDFGDASDESFDAGDATASAEDSLGNVDLSALDDMDFGMGDSSGDGFGDSSNGGLGDGADASSFDDIEIKDTDENFGSSDSGDDFELGGDDDFLIPGFSDTQEADFSQHAQKEVNPVAVGQALAGEPKKDSLTEEEYEKFKKNLSGYPLNVKIAIEEMIANNDFTEDAIFEVIDKVIKKTQARQLAIYLEKILDISLPVPRDFEHRTVEEYEAYKASFEYQLKNRIIPLALITIGVGLISTFLFMCGKHYIYRPLKAESLYRQGYALLQADEYPQSEQKFKEAVHYRNSKKWFYRYARGYREHKQYERAAVMYDDILKRFKNDKPAGLEYAQMEWQDLSNYEGAVRLLNDRMLMYYVNDPDGLLELGDIYLDWADNGETEMYENARINYATLINLYGSKDLYLSRMMRYFIRTDNLREVLQLKEIFYPRKKSLGAQDLTELSGYMFDKMTGKLSANEAYLKDKIEDVKALMERAIEADNTNPTALYNMARYHINMSNFNRGISYLDAAIDAFKKVPRLKKADVYRQIDSYRLKGELFVRQKEIIKAVETFTDGISAYKAQTPALPGNHIVGKLYADMADIDYFNFNDIDSAYEYYKAAVENENDTPSIRYKIGAIQYEKGYLHEAMGSFMATAEFVPEDNNLLMALGNVLINRNSYSAAKGYYEHLVGNLDAIRSSRGILMPQVDVRDQDVVDMYMKASNNLAVTLYHLAKRTGNSNLNAQAIINFTESLRAWDALTRNQETMKRLPGTNLAQENIQYVLKPRSNFEPAIYPDIPRTLSVEEKNIIK